MRSELRDFACNAGRTLSWREMSLRNYNAVWGIANPYSLTGHAEPSPFLFRLLVMGGFDGSWVGRPG